MKDLMDFCTGQKDGPIGICCLPLFSFLVYLIYFSSVSLPCWQFSGLCLAAFTFERQSYIVLWCIYYGLSIPLTNVNIVEGE